MQSSEQRALMHQDVFRNEFIAMCDKCGFTVRDRIPDVYYGELCNFPAEYIRLGFKNMVDTPPSKLTLASVKANIRAKMPVNRRETPKGCDRCEYGLIAYKVRKNGTEYDFIAKCHYCRTSTLKHIMYYNEIFPVNYNERAEHEAR